MLFRVMKEGGSYTYYLRLHGTEGGGKSLTKLLTSGNNSALRERASQIRCMKRVPNYIA
jgi:hypothetical protein